MALAIPAHAATLRVGSQHELKTFASAAKLAQDGDTVEVETGDYEADVAIWTQNRLTLRRIGQRPRLIAKGAAAEGKAIWVVRGGDITIDNFEFSGTRVGDKNGAGIRLENGRLSVRNCRFTGTKTASSLPAASYELEFPNGGIAHVVGNLIEQSATTKNDIIVSYGAEGYKHPANRLYLINNTLIDRKSASI